MISRGRASTAALLSCPLLNYHRRYDLPAPASRPRGSSGRVGEEQGSEAGAQRPSPETQTAPPARRAPGISQAGEFLRTIPPGSCRDARATAPRPLRLPALRWLPLPTAHARRKRERRDSQTAYEQREPAVPEPTIPSPPVTAPTMAGHGEAAAQVNRGGRVAYGRGRERCSGFRW